jgi:hypothetical protein
MPFVRKVTGLPDYVRRVHRELRRAPSAIPRSPRRRAGAVRVLARRRRAASSSSASRERFLEGADHVKLASMSSDLVFEQIHTRERSRPDVRRQPITARVTGSGRLFSTLDHYSSCRRSAASRPRS